MNEPSEVTAHSAATPWRWIVGLVLAGLVVVACLLPAIQRPRELGGPRRSRHNLKMIGLAIHNYETRYRSLPPGWTEGPEERPLQSWQTLLLPYVDQGPVYDRIRLELPWDDAANREPCTTWVQAFAHPEVERTDIRGYPVSHYVGNSQVLPAGGGLPFGKIPDGLSNTLFCGEVGAGALPWARPGNVRDPAIGLGVSPEQFGMKQPSGAEGACFVWLDGAVRYLDRKIDPAVLKALASPAGGEEVGDFLSAGSTPK